MAAGGLIAPNGDRSETTTGDGFPKLRSRDQEIMVIAPSDPFATPSPEEPGQRDAFSRPAFFTSTDLLREIMNRGVLQDIMSEEDLRLASISRPDWVISEIDRLVNQLKEVKELFDDLLQRQISFSNFKMGFEELFRHYIAASRDSRAQAFSLVSEGLRGLRAENLEIRQVEALVEVMKVCRKDELNREDLIYCNDILDNAQIETI